MARQSQIPGGPFVNETGTRQSQIPGGPYINETVSTTPTFLAAWARNSNQIIGSNPCAKT
jgi:hypothetical protein